MDDGPAEGLADTFQRLMMGALWVMEPISSAMASPSPSEQDPDKRLQDALARQAARRQKASTPGESIFTKKRKLHPQAIPLVILYVVLAISLVSLLAPKSPAPSGPAPSASGERPADRVRKCVEEATAEQIRWYVRQTGRPAASASVPFLYYKALLAQGVEPSEPLPQPDCSALWKD